VKKDLRHELGRLGECFAADHLERLGFLIVERNFRTRIGEIDLVAADDRTLIFCEVKTKRAESHFPWVDRLTPAKQRQVRKMARIWLAGTERSIGGRQLRCDAIGVKIDSCGELVALEHLEAAF
jgi:putative endonuclease